MEKKSIATNEKILQMLVEDYYNQGLDPCEVQMKLHELYDECEGEYTSERDQYLDYADALYANIDRNKTGSYNYKEYPFVEEQKPKKRSNKPKKRSKIVMTFDNLREHRKQTAPEKEEEWSGYGFLELSEEEKREAWAMMVRYDAPKGKEFDYYENLMHGLMYPSESRLSKYTNSLDELVDFWVNYCECQPRKVAESDTYPLLKRMLSECLLRYDCAKLAYNLILARNIIHGFAEGCEANYREFSAEELAEHAGDD